MKKTVLALALGTALFYSCGKDDAPAKSNTVELTATLNGANEVPANTSTATGVVTGTYNKDTKSLGIVVTWTGFTATVGHIHKGAAGVSGGVQWGFPTPVTSPLTYTSTVAFTQPQEDSLLGGLYYVNIHSAQFGGGEIRGQLNKK
jgi:Flp pilus assembly protein TadG